MRVQARSAPLRRRYGHPYHARVVRSRYGIAVVAALVALPAAADAAPGTLDLRQSFDRSRGVYVEGSVSYVRVRGIRGKLVVAKRVGPAALSDAAPAGARPLPGDQLPAALRRQLRDARPAHRPLRAAACGSSPAA